MWLTNINISNVVSWAIWYSDICIDVHIERVHRIASTNNFMKQMEVGMILYKLASDTFYIQPY